jgi:flagella basal body P-ring formation protein FlgA
VVALSDGGMGDVIRVRRAGERTEFPARVSGPGQVEVIVSP